MPVAAVNKICSCLQDDAAELKLHHEQGMPVQARIVSYRLSTQSGNNLAHPGSVNQSDHHVTLCYGTLQLQLLHYYCNTLFCYLADVISSKSTIIEWPNGLLAILYFATNYLRSLPGNCHTSEHISSHIHRHDQTILLKEVLIQLHQS